MPEERLRWLVRPATQEQLEAITEEAIQFLAPKFDIGGEQLRRMRRPKVGVVNPSTQIAYSPEANEMFVPNNLEMSDTFGEKVFYYVVGGSVGTYLDFQKDPDQTNGVYDLELIRKNQRKFFLEFAIPHICGFIYSHHKGEGYNAVAIRTVFELAERSGVLESMRAERPLVYLGGGGITIHVYDFFRRYGEEAVGKIYDLSLAEIEKITGIKSLQN